MIIWQFITLKQKLSAVAQDAPLQPPPPISKGSIDQKKPYTEMEQYLADMTRANISRGSPVRESCTPGSIGGVPCKGCVYQPNIKYCTINSVMYGQYNKITEKSLCYKDNMLCFLCIFRNLLIYSKKIILLLRKFIIRRYNI